MSGRRTTRAKAKELELQQNDIVTSVETIAMSLSPRRSLRLKRLNNNSAILPQGSPPQKKSPKTKAKAKPVSKAQSKLKPQPSTSTSKPSSSSSKSTRPKGKNVKKKVRVEAVVEMDMMAIAERYLEEAEEYIEKAERFEKEAHRSMDEADGHSRKGEDLVEKALGEEGPHAIKLYEAARNTYNAARMCLEESVRCNDAATRNYKVARNYYEAYGLCCPSCPSHTII